MSDDWSLQLTHPWWLTLGLLAVPLALLGWRALASLGKARRLAAVALRCLVVGVLAMLLAQPCITRKARKLTLITVLDRSRSVNEALASEALAHLDQALASKPSADAHALIDVAEAASVAKLPTADVTVKRRNTHLPGLGSRLSAGLQLGLAVAPADSGLRMLLVSDGNETAGDLREAARTAAANNIPIDVLPLRYTHPNEVVFTHLVAPVKARSGQTVALRMVLRSTARSQGTLLLTLNGKPVDLDPSSASLGVDVQLEPGVNVKTVSLPLGARGMHQFSATYLPDLGQDGIEDNNRATAMTFIAGPGHVLVIEREGSGQALAAALSAARIDARRIAPSALPDDLAGLTDCDAVVLANIDASALTFRQHEMLCRYVKELGGGLVMAGGPNAFGAGGWIGSPLAQALPVDLDPPQKKQMPKGALALIMHACEMPEGNFWGKRVAIAAVESLSRLDLVGVLDYSWQDGNDHWVYPLGEVGDRSAAIAAIQNMNMGDMPDFGAPLQAAYDKLKAANAGQKHVIIISDGDPSMPSPQLLGKCRQAGITVTGVAVFPHSPSDVQTLANIAQATGGRFYNVRNSEELPQIFIKEAQVVRRALIVENKFTPKITFGVSEIVRGLPALPPLNGYVLTGPRQGLAQLILTTPQGDPILAGMQVGMGRSVAFTSSADGRWDASWLAWGGYARFWEQVVRWVGRPAQANDAELFVDLHGRRATLTVEAAEVDGQFVQFAQIAGQIIAPDLSVKEVPLTQVGPGRYRSQFDADTGGAYLVNLRYTKVGSDAQPQLMHAVVTAPFSAEFNHLSDNAALLAEVAALTGGRVLALGDTAAPLFDRTGVRFPQWSTPIRQGLALAWLALFLLDVAVRRVAIDFRAVARALAARLPRWRKAQARDATLDQLRLRRQQHMDQVRHRTAEQRQQAARRFEPADLPADEVKIDSAPSAPAAPIAPQTTPAASKPAGEPSRPATPLDQLLQAKRRTRGARDDSSPQDTTGDS